MLGLIGGEFRLSKTIYFKYPLNSISLLVSYVAIFYGMIGGSYLASGNPILGHNLNALVVGYSLWILIQRTIDEMGLSISQEADNGTLEQIYISNSISKVLFAKGVVNMIFSSIFILITAAVILFFTGHRIVLDPREIIPIACALFASLGLGYAVAGITVYAKRIDNLLQIIQYLFLALLLIPYGNAGIYLRIVSYFVPLAPMVSVLKQLTNGSAMVSYNDLLVLPLINALFWFALGYLVFSFCNVQVQKKGTIGHY
ncbi:hypothetical protein [Oenococcus oeni]|uniref:hypothetical protein n=1 Tax=Oenococcus oeni TaxID=1247 RepID=UPI0010B74B41|nr:hypothetical protein [Oenococcus oeni]SYW14859.1 ABC-type polysaccharide/polyol phosphate export system permease component [Oenococcus oeni]